MTSKQTYCDGSFLHGLKSQDWWRLLVLVGRPEVKHNNTRKTTSLTDTQVYCNSLVKTASSNWDHICNIWFLSSCAKYTKHVKQKQSREYNHVNS